MSGPIAAAPVAGGGRERELKSTPTEKRKKMKLAG